MAFWPTATIASHGKGCSGDPSGPMPILGEPEEVKKVCMDRRRFLLKSAGMLVGGLFSLNSFAKAFGEEAPGLEPFLQPRIALIIDDIGHNRTRARQFLKLNAPITFSVLPRLKFSYDLAVEIHDRGHETMLHQPMEPYHADVFDPGPGALYLGYEADRIGRILDENITEVPFALGVNNHMGSKFTECPKKMMETLSVIKEKKLFFVDSLTSSRSTAYQTSRQLKIAAVGRNRFLDNIREESAILRQLLRLKRHAQRFGYAVGIGHPFPETAQAIGVFLKGLKKSAISLCYISKIL